MWVCHVSCEGALAPRGDVRLGWLANPQKIMSNTIFCGQAPRFQSVRWFSTGSQLQDSYDYTMQVLEPQTTVENQNGHGNKQRVLLDKLDPRGHAFEYYCKGTCAMQIEP